MGLWFASESQDVLAADDLHASAALGESVRTIDLLAGTRLHLSTCSLFGAIVFKRQAIHGFIEGVGIELLCHLPLFVLHTVRHIGCAACIELLRILRVRVGDRYILQSRRKLVVSGIRLLLFHGLGEVPIVSVLFAHDLQCQYPVFQDLKLPLEVRFYELKAPARIALAILIRGEAVEQVLDIDELQLDRQLIRLGVHGCLVLQRMAFIVESGGGPK
jgi:hypothetical protein